MRNIITHELARHAPFTAMGALSGIVIMLIFHNLPYNTAFNAFYICHPLHVLLSALVTASMYHNYKCAGDRTKCSIWALLVIGYVGSVGIATLSDSIMPYLGERLLHMPHAEPHIGFIERWYFVLPVAFIGIFIAYYKPTTKIPHAGHVLISTWASLFHIIMAKGQILGIAPYFAIFIFLFLAVWVPCCVSDIVFPLLFVGGEKAHSHS